MDLRRQARMQVLLIALLLMSLPVWLSGAEAQGRGGVLRIGMTAADIPYTGGQPDQGFEGFRFIGFQLYDGLVRWDLSQGERLPDLAPGLAESWEVSPQDHTRWIFHLRRGVKFHDGTDFNADAVLWNWDKIKTKDAPQYDARQAGIIHWATTEMQSWRKLDNYTLELTTTRPSSFIPFQLTYILMASPTQWEKVGRDWQAFANHPVGTGPFKLTQLVPRERAELEPFPEY
jgi:peptide/nickel transport system substrate-binding protein